MDSMVQKCGEGSGGVEVERMRWNKRDTVAEAAVRRGGPLGASDAQQVSLLQGHGGPRSEIGSRTRIDKKDSIISLVKLSMALNYQSRPVAFEAVHHPGCHSSPLGSGLSICHCPRAYAQLSE